MRCHYTAVLPAKLSSQAIATARATAARTSPARQRKQQGHARAQQQMSRQWASFSNSHACLITHHSDVQGTAQTAHRVSTTRSRDNLQLQIIKARCTSISTSGHMQMMQMINFHGYTITKSDCIHAWTHCLQSCLHLPTCINSF